MKIFYFLPKKDIMDNRGTFWGIFEFFAIGDCFLLGSFATEFEDDGPMVTRIGGSESDDDGAGSIELTVLKKEPMSRCDMSANVRIERRRTSMVQENREVIRGNFDADTYCII